MGHRIGGGQIESEEIATEVSVGQTRGREIEDGVEEKVEAAAGGGEEGAPPPLVVLVAELGGRKDRSNTVLNGQCRK